MAENGKSEKVSVLTISFDHETSLVSVSADQELPICLAQMMLDEAVRYMEEKRKEITLNRIKQELEQKARLAAALQRGVARQ